MKAHPRHPTTTTIALLLAVGGCSLMAPSEESLSGGGGPSNATDGGANPDATDGGSIPDATSEPSPDGSCGAGMKLCGSSCVSAADPDFGCAATSCAGCALTGAVMTCEQGACAVQGCLPGSKDCNGSEKDGCETNVQTDPENCGSCAKACKANQICSAGKCAANNCPAGTGDCNADPGDGCEADLTSSQEHCGACGHACAVAHGTSTCQAGSCKLVSCAAPWSDCDNDGKSCEVDTSSSGSNCGACGKACGNVPHGHGACSASSCTVACDPGWEDCNAQPGDGCETDVTKSLANCGGCGTVCSGGPNADPVCVAGDCGLACKGLSGDCNGQSNDGCEASLTSVQHCGSCATTCAAEHGTPGCSNTGVCTLLGCDPGWGNCDLLASNGCETPLLSDPSNCGACGNTCQGPANATGNCASGLCGGWTCNPGYGNCDGSSSNGCEIELLGDPTNCGACGHDCQGAPCSNGVCVPLSLAPEGSKHLAIDETHVYYSTAGGIRRVPKTGGVPETVSAPNQYAPGFLLVDATHVYWTENGPSKGTIQRAAKAAGSATSTVVTTVDAFGAYFSLDDTMIYYADLDDSDVHKVAKSGGTTTLVSSFTSGARGAFTDNDNNNVYITRSGAISRLYWAAKSGGTAATLSDVPDPGSVLLDATDVYFRGSTGIQRISKSGGNSTSLVSTLDHDYACAMAMDASTIYYSEPSAGRISAVPKGGGSPVVYAQGLPSPCTVALDSSYLYWADSTGIKVIAR